MSRFSRQHSYLSLNPLGMVFISAGIFFIMDVAQSKLYDFDTYFMWRVSKYVIMKGVLTLLYLSCVKCCGLFVLSLPTFVYCSLSRVYCFLFMRLRLTSHHFLTFTQTDDVSVNALWRVQPGLPGRDLSLHTSSFVWYTAFNAFIFSLNQTWNFNFFLPSISWNPTTMTDLMGLFTSNMNKVYLNLSERNNLLRKWREDEFKS